MSLADDFLQANPPLEIDHFGEAYTQEFASAEAERFNEWIEKEGYPRASNMGILQQWLDVNNFAICFYNLKVAYFWCRTEGLLIFDTSEADEPEPETKIPYSKPTVLRATLTPEAQQENAELVSTLRELDRVAPARQDSWKRPTVDVSPEFRELVHKSRAANRNGGKVRHMSEAEARAQIAIQMPHLKIDSPEYNAWTARLQFNQNSDD